MLSGERKSKTKQSSNPTALREALNTHKGGYAGEINALF